MHTSAQIACIIPRDLTPSRGQLWEGPGVSFGVISTSGHHCGVAREGPGWTNNPGSRKEDKMDQVTAASVGSAGKCFQRQKAWLLHRMKQSQKRGCVAATNTFWKQPQHAEDFAFHLRATQLSSEVAHLSYQRLPRSLSTAQKPSKSIKKLQGNCN